MSPDHSQEDVCWHQRSVFFLCGIFLFRMVYAWVYSFDLSGDEAYYWDWGRHLAWGYYSKPPLIGWLMALLRIAHLDSGAGIRAASALIGTGTLSLIYLLAARLFSPRVGFWALCVTAATIGNVALTICMTTDAPLTLCWCGALYSFWRLSEKASFRWSVALMLCWGIGALAKQMMLVFFPIGLIFLLLSPQKKRLLGEPLLWGAWLGSMLFLVPSLWWNSKHDWITFQHTSAHLRGEPFSWVKAFAQMVEFLGSQLGLATPVTFVMIILVFALLFRKRKELGDRERYLLLFSAPPLLFFLAFSFHRSINPNWPLVYYLPGMILLAGVCCQQGKALFCGLRRGIAIGVGLCVAFYVTMALLPSTGLDLTRIVPLREISGWSAYGAEIGRIQHQLPHPEKIRLIVVGHRYHVAALAFYHPDRPVVYQWPSMPGVHCQYDLWPGLPDDGSNVLVIVAGGSEVPADLSARFNRLERLQDLTIPVGGRKPKRYCLYFGTRESK